MEIKMLLNGWFNTQKDQRKKGKNKNTHIY